MQLKWDQDIATVLILAPLESPMLDTSFRRGCQGLCPEPLRAMGDRSRERSRRIKHVKLLGVMAKRRVAAPLLAQNLLPKIVIS
jgi:hypothetical protein